MTVIIPSWQTRDYLTACLAGLAQADDIKVLVVDNASTDGSAAAAAAMLPPGAVVRLPENRGFAAAVNAGAQLALKAGTDDDVLILLNSDTIATPAALRRLSEHLKENPQTGAVAPQLLLADGSPQPYGFGGDPVLPYLWRRGWQRLRHRRALHDWGDRQRAQVDWVSFACVAISRRAWRTIGPLDETYFMYFEDNDWCLRARQKKWHIERLPSAQIIHHGGAGLKQSPRAAQAYRRSLKHFYRKHYTRPARLLLALLLPLYAKCR